MYTIFKKQVQMSLVDVVMLGGDPYESNRLNTINLIIGKRKSYQITIDFHYKNLFPNLPMDDGEDNRMVHIEFDAVLKSNGRDFELDMQDFINMLTYKEECGISFSYLICPLCKKSILENVISGLNEDYSYFCSNCNELIKIR